MANSHNEASTLLAVSWTLGFVIICMSTARIWVRWKIVGHTGWDDLFNVLATISALICSALVTVATLSGLGRPKNSIADSSDLTNAIKYTIIAPVLSVVSSTFGKLSALLLLVRLMGVTAQRWHLVTLWTICGIMVALNVLIVVLVIGFCYPAAKQWDKSIDGWCMDLEVQLVGSYVQVIYNALMDMIVATAPALVIKNLNLSRLTKLGLCLMMGGGWFAAAATIAKLYYLKGLSNHADITISWSPITVLYTAEMNSIIIFGTIPTLWPLKRVLTDSLTHCCSHRGAYIDINNIGDHPCGRDAYELLERGPRRAGPATRALEELDNMRSRATITAWE